MPLPAPESARSGGGFWPTAPRWSCTQTVARRVTVAGCGRRRRYEALRDSDAGALGATVAGAGRRHTVAEIRQALLHHLVVRPIITSNRPSRSRPLGLTRCTGYDTLPLMSDNQSIDIAKEIDDVVDRLKPLLTAVADGLQFRDIKVFVECLPPFIDELIDFFDKAGGAFSEVRENVEELRAIWDQRRSASR